MEPPPHSSSANADDVHNGLPPRTLLQSLSVPSHNSDDTFALSPRSMASLSPPSLMRPALATAASRLLNGQVSPCTEQDSTSADLSPVARGRVLQHYASSPDSLSPGSAALDSLSNGSRALWSPNTVPAAARAAKVPLLLTSGGNKSDVMLSVSPESGVRQTEDTATATVTPSVSQDSPVGQTPASSNDARTRRRSGSAGDDEDDDDAGADADVGEVGDGSDDCDSGSGNLSPSAPAARTFFSFSPPRRSSQGLTLDLRKHGLGHDNDSSYDAGGSSVRSVAAYDDEGTPDAAGLGLRLGIGVGSPGSTGSPPPSTAADTTEDTSSTDDSCELASSEEDELQAEGDASEDADSLLGWRQTCEFFLNEPQDYDATHGGIWARLVMVAVFAVVLASQAVLCIESVPSYYDASVSNEHPWRGFEIFFAVFFSVEVLFRFTCSTWRKGAARYFFTQPLNVTDILAVLPFYIELLLSSVYRWQLKLSILRVFRVVRVVKVYRVHSGLNILVKALQAASSQLQMGFVFIAASIYVWSAWLFIAERSSAIWDEARHEWVARGEVPGDGARLHPFQSIPHSFWWCVVTLTTVGYGDVVPATAQGKVVASFAMVTSVFILALPTSIIGAKFLELYRVSKEEKQAWKRKIRKAERRVRRNEQGRGGGRDSESVSTDSADDDDGDGDGNALAAGSSVGGNEDEIVDLLVYLDELDAAGKLAPSQVLMDGETGRIIVQPGDGEAIRSLVLEPSRYPAVRAAYLASKKAPTPALSLSRFLKHAAELALQDRFFSTQSQQHDTGMTTAAPWQPPDHLVEAMGGR